MFFIGKSLNLIQLILSLTFLFFSAFGRAAEENPLQIKVTNSAHQIQAGENFQLQAELSLPAGHHAYSDKFKFKIKDPEGFQTGQIKITPEKMFFDKVSGKNKMGIAEQANFSAVIESPTHLNPGDYVIQASLFYQACTDTYCLFPTERVFAIPIQIKGDLNQSQTSEYSIFNLDFQSAMKKGLVWAFLMVFIAGFLTSLTPCIFPIIPITIAVLGRHAHTHSKRKNFLLSNLYVLGIALTYAALGVFAAATGAMFGSFMSHPLVLTVICLVFLLMSLSMFGLFEMQAPLFIRKRLSGDLHLHGYSSAFVYGIIAGIVVGPCVGPVLVGILTFVAKTQNLWLGFWLLFTFAVGMGQLFLLLGLSSQMTKLLPKSGSWMDAVKNFFGLLMMGAFYYYLSLLIPIRFWDAALGIGLVLYGSLFGAFESTQNLSLFGKLKKGFCQLLIFVGAACVIIGIFNFRQEFSVTKATSTTSQESTKWQTYSDEALSLALQNKKPVLIDFWADWCGACLELEKNTFHHPLFLSAAADFVLLKFDATNDSEKLRELKKKYEIVGLPTLIFYDKTGTYRKDLTITEFVEAPVFVEKLKQISKN